MEEKKRIILCFKSGYDCNAFLYSIHNRFLTNNINANFKPDHIITDCLEISLIVGGVFKVCGLRADFWWTDDRDLENYILEHRCPGERVINALDTMKTIIMKIEKEHKNMPTETRPLATHFYTPNIFDPYHKPKLPEINNVVFSGPCTIVFWSDDTKTIVRCGDNDKFDKEKGLAMAVAKKFLGTNSSKANYNDIFKKWIPEEIHIVKRARLDHFASAREIAEKTGQSYKRTLKDLNEGAFDGAFKDSNGRWCIPVYDM